MFGRRGRRGRGFSGWLAGVAVLLGAPVATAQTSDAGNEHYEQKRLPNGLGVGLVEDHRVPLVAITIRYPVGVTLDPPNARGTAAVLGELLPHLGTKHLPDGVGDLIGASGFYPWEAQAFARDDDTQIGVVVPAGAVDLALFIEAERMGFAADGITPQAVEVAKAKVTEAFEHEKGTANVDLAVTLAYGPAHPYATVSEPPSLGDVSAEALKQRLRRFYNVAGAKLSIVGDFDSARVMPIVERYFGALQGQPLPAEAPITTAPSSKPRVASLKSEQVDTGFVWTWRTPQYLSPDDIALDVAARYIQHVLGLRFAQGAERGVTAARETSMRRGSAFWLYVGLPHGQDRAAAERQARAELDALSSGKVDQSELDVAKTKIIAEISASMDDLYSRSHMVLSYSDYDGKLDSFGPHLEQYRKVDAARLSDVVRRYLGQPAGILNLTQAAAGQPPSFTGLEHASYAPPALSSDIVQADGPAWYKPPTPVALPRFDPPRVRESRVGASRVLSMARAGLPTIELGLSLNWQGGVKAPEVRNLLLNTLLHAHAPGKPTLPARLGDLGASLSVNEDPDVLNLTATGLAERADAIAEALREAFELEHFDKSAFDTAREDVLKEAQAAKSDEWQDLQAWGEKLLFVPSHRYHQELVDRAARLKALEATTLPELERFWQGERRAERVGLSIVGPVDDARVAALAKAALPHFKAGKPSKPGAAGVKPHVFLVDAPGVDQALVQFAWPVSAWGSPGFVDGLGLRWLLIDQPGLGFTKVLKEAGITSPGDWRVDQVSMRDFTRILLGFRVPKEQVPALLKAVTQYGKVLEKGEIRWDGVQAARRQATERFTRNFEGAEGCLALLDNQLSWDVSASSGEDQYLLAQRMDRESLAKAAPLLAPANATVLIYGSVSGLEQQLGGLGYGAISVEHASPAEKPNPSPPAQPEQTNGSTP